MKDTKPPEAGDPATTPFVYYVGGVPVYPPNTIREAVRIAITESETRNLKVVLQERIRRGFIGGTASILPESWWYHFLFNYVTFFANNFSEPQEIEHLSKVVLEIIARGRPQEVWQELVGFIVGQVDVLSGWNKSWVKESAEERNVSKGEDGNYYCQELDGIMVRVIGATTLPETHLDFVTDHILRGHGCLRQIFNVFATFAIADEYALDSGMFPRSMKAMLEPQFNSTYHKWQLIQFQRTRSIKWRPLSNFCDPDWLAGDLLGRITDTLDRDPWRKKVEKQKGRPNKLEDDCPFQMDYALDSSVSIGAEDEIYIDFDKRIFRWVNGSAESKATISVGYKAVNSHQAEDDSLNRFLSLLVWQHRQAVVKQEGIGGPKRPLPHIWAPRSSLSLRIDPQYLYFDSDTYSPQRWLALALYKEGVNSQSVFYRFFSFWKIIEVAIKEKKVRWDWINAAVVTLGAESARVTQILQQNTNVAGYLDYSCRSAIAHVFSEPLINPDDYADYVRISQDVRVVEELARKAVDEFLSTTVVKP